MIFPDDYKQVGIKDEERRGERIYFATQFLISREGPRLYRVQSSGDGFMRAAEDLELIAEGKDLFFYPTMLDTRNRALLIELADEICRGSEANTVVFQGPDEHITFVKDPDPGEILNLDVLDVSPPDPPWLIYVLQRLEDCGVLGDLTVRFRPHILDLRLFDCECVYYPCRASGLGRSLDCDKVVHELPRIVGCDVSREIFLANNPGKNYEFVNICPLQSRDEVFKPNGPFITRCCRSERRGLTRKNGQPGFAVHWGDGPWKVAEAVRCLVQELRR
ncbi:MAG TPA: hypothetical protein VLY86_04150 [Methanothrix sp.]|nr:hypothetical protein [Methanothrix sp.]